ncbi:hypothetical protein CRV03_05425 [Arcobacter sp. F155]|uniref:hypothetical protein n=1 Tax=Arcobacteraceae TaxID=2808963 RepID=UPI00100BB0F3|nr:MULTISPECIES: hypothetical protein [unclassified Arcobacter]RXJ77673.1 hypothetical protein CRV03_05425 [Arcobacter sp. F155]RXK01661.1 hypothetical protein CRV02_07210 [Arcobacter sp. CECT 8989]
MPAIFTANVEESDNDTWVIRLTDTEDTRQVICQDMEDFSKQLALMSEDYGSDIEVQWSKDDDVTDEHFYELHQQMAKIKEDLDLDE